MFETDYQRSTGNDRGVERHLRLMVGTQRPNNRSRPRGRLSAPENQGRYWIRFEAREAVVSSHSSKIGEERRASTSTSSNKASTAAGAGPISIEIGGQRLNIRSDHDSAFVQHLARHIDSKLEELQSAAPTMPMNKLLMLTSMTVAEELFESREELRQMRRQLKDTTQTMFELIDQAEEL